MGDRDEGQAFGVFFFGGKVSATFLLTEMRSRAISCFGFSAGARNDLIMLDGA